MPHSRSARTLARLPRAPFESSLSPPQCLSAVTASPCPHLPQPTNFSAFRRARLLYSEGGLSLWFFHGFTTLVPWNRHSLQITFIQFMHRSASQQTDRPFHICFQDLDRSRHSRLSRCAKPIRIRPSAQHRSRP